jgi:hypothetical protein
VRAASLILTTVGLLCSLAGIAVSIRAMRDLARARQLNPKVFAAVDRVRWAVLTRLGRQRPPVVVGAATGNGLRLRGGTAVAKWEPKPAETLEERVEQLEGTVRGLQTLVALERKERRDSARRDRQAAREGVERIERSLRDEGRRIDAIDTGALNGELWGLLLVAVGTVLLGLGAILSLLGGN